MCTGVELLLAGAAMSATSSLVGAAATSAAAQSEADWRNYQLDVQNKQLKDEQEMTMLKAQQTEAARLEQERRLRASNEAWVAATGVGENKSYLEGAEKYNDRQARQDIATLRLNSADQINRIADQIAVNKAEGQFAYGKAAMTSSAAWATGALNAGSSLLKGYGTYSYYKS
jgi:NCAIR mutase (PurE)-related protein